MTRGNTRRAVAILLCCAVSASGCATGARFAAVPAPGQDAQGRALMSEYVQKLPLGTAVKVDRVQGRTVRGILMKATPDSLIVQARTRLPEPPVEIPMNDVLRVAADTPGGGSLAKAIGAGAAAGAGAALGVFLILVAVFSD